MTSVVRRSVAGGFIALAAGLLCRGATGDVAAAEATTVRVYRDVAYGPDPRQRFDVYAPANARNAPVIFMVHGGGWAAGDKRARGVADNKSARWVPRGFVVISTNYRLLPDADPIAQAGDVARAIARAQQLAPTWGADRTKFILMGHSAGAHLVALVATSPAARDSVALAPWLGVVSLESGALDVADVMSRPHERLYDRAFGDDSAYWRRASPLHTLESAGPPMLFVCSIPRRTSCDQAEAFAARARPLGMRVEIARERLTHAQADRLLGVDSVYTAQVEGFLRTLDSTVAARLPAAQ